MIRVLVEDNGVCKRCPSFEPEVHKDPTTYLNGCLVSVNIDIYCRHRFICRHCKKG